MTPKLTVKAKQDDCTVCSSQKALSRGCILARRLQSIVGQGPYQVPHEILRVGNEYSSIALRNAPFVWAWQVLSIVIWCQFRPRKEVANLLARDVR